jgi:hypothetical protein
VNSPINFVFLYIQGEMQRALTTSIIEVCFNTCVILYFVINSIINITKKKMIKKGFIMALIAVSIPIKIYFNLVLL